MKIQALARRLVFFDKFPYEIYDVKADKYSENCQKKCPAFAWNKRGPGTGCRSGKLRQTVGYRRQHREHIYLLAS